MNLDDDDDYDDRHDASSSPNTTTSAEYHNIFANLVDIVRVDLSTRYSAETREHHDHDDGNGGDGDMHDMHHMHHETPSENVSFPRYKVDAQVMHHPRVRARLAQPDTCDTTDDDTADDDTLDEEENSASAATRQHSNEEAMIPRQLDALVKQYDDHVHRLDRLIHTLQRRLQDEDAAIKTRAVCSQYCDDDGILQAMHRLSNAITSCVSSDLNMFAQLYRRIRRHEDMCERVLRSIGNEQCKICYDQPFNMVLIPCGHVFCHACIVSCNQTNDNVCPYCRQPYHMLQRIKRA